MRVRIGIADTGKLVELEVEDVDAFRQEVERAFDHGGVAWFVDAKGRTVGIPTRSVAFVEIDTDSGDRTIGFAPGGLAG